MSGREASVRVVRDRSRSAEARALALERRAVRVAKYGAALAPGAAGGRRFG